MKSKSVFLLSFGIIFAIGAVFIVCIAVLYLIGAEEDGSDNTNSQSNVSSPVEDQSVLNDTQPLTLTHLENYESFSLTFIFGCIDPLSCISYNTTITQDGAVNIEKVALFEFFGEAEPTEFSIDQDSVDKIINSLITNDFISFKDDYGDENSSIENFENVVAVSMLVDDTFLKEVAVYDDSNRPEAFDEITEIIFQEAQLENYVAEDVFEGFFEDFYAPFFELFDEQLDSFNLDTFESEE